jgi:hypothetical protein
MQTTIADDNLAPEFDPVPLILAEPWRLEPHTFAEHVSAGRWKAWRHLQFIGEQVAEEIVAGDGRLIVMMPPGHGKSELLSHWTPVWLLDNLPDRRIIACSHGDELAAHFGRVVRNEFENNDLLTTVLSPDSSAADRWHTPQGGGMKTGGVGSGLTGWRANVILIDDPHPTWEAVHSPTHREHVWDWFTGTIADRLEPHGTIIVLMHHWHEDDLAGRLPEKHPDRWKIIRLPALAHPGDPLGRAEGEALCPERFDVAALNAKRLEVGPLVWAGKYDQNPLGVGGGRVYANFTPDANVDKGLSLQPYLPLHLSFDFNRNPGMHAIVGQYDRFADLFTAVHEIHGPYMKLQPCLDAFVKLINEVGGGSFPWPELHVFGDPAGNQDRAETTLTAWQQVHQKLTPWMREHGKPIQFKVPRGQFPVRTRIDTFNQALCDPAGDVHYKVHPRCERLLADLKYLKADAQGLVDKSDEKLSHASEAEANRVARLRPIIRRVQKVGRVGVAGGGRSA